MYDGLTDSLHSGPLRTRIMQVRDRGIVVEIPAIPAVGSSPLSSAGAFYLENKRGFDANLVPIIEGNPRGYQSVDLQTARGSTATRVASGNLSVISGGANNTASGWLSTVIGGYANSSSGQSSVSGGYSCTASGAYAVTLGYACASNGTTSIALGNASIASANFSVALGIYSGTTRTASFAIGGYDATSQWQHSCVFVRRTTTDATPADLTIDGLAPTGTAIATSNRVIIAANTALDCTIYVTGLQKKTEGNGYASYIRRCVITRDNSNNTTVSAVQTIGTDIETDAVWDVAITADNTNEALVVTVTGEAAKTIRWYARIEANEITHA